VIVLDTNVVSEILRHQPDPGVLQWFDAQDPHELWLTSVVAAELMFGIAKMPQGARQRQLAQAMSTMLEQDFAARVLAFDLNCASVYADLVARQQRQGRAIAMADAQIAATCLANAAQLATRNSKHFEELGLTLINPWL
jgi:predicted nucleic acid-binding protein